MIIYNSKRKSNLSCEKCTKTPKIPENIKKIVVFANHDYILDKFHDIFKDTCDIKVSTDYIELIGDFKNLIADISSSKKLTKVELENMTAIFIEPDEVPTFGSFKKAKTMYHWITLYNSADLKYILDNGSLITYFQPIFDLKNMNVFAYETLTRGVKADGSLMSPLEMFTLAKDCDMIFNLDSQCRLFAIKNSKMKNIEKNIFINFTPTSIYNPEFCLRDTVKLADELKFDFNKIVFEVIESEKVENLTHLKNIFDFYRSVGFRIALDDVGSGFSSLNMVAQLKPDIIKIDMELIRNINNDLFKKTIVKSLVNIAQDIGASTVAEGIENAEELNTVLDLNVDLAQGYFLGKPTLEILN